MPLFSKKSSEVPTASEAMPGRSERPFALTGTHYVSGESIVPPFPADTELAQFGMGCFWGAERLFWHTPGVVATAVGYAGGHTTHPTYQEVCSGRTGHAEVVLVAYDPERVSYEELLTVFWEGHDPTQGMRQGNDRGTQYRSVAYWYDEQQRKSAEASKDRYQDRLSSAGYGAITTEITAAGDFYYAEDYHQQYLAKNPNGYCGIGGTGVACPTGLATE